MGSFRRLILLALFVPAVWANAQDGITESRRNALVKAIEKASPAVVSINIIQTQTQRVIDPFLRDFWGLFDVPPVRKRVRNREFHSVGSGFIFDKDGHVLTNYHVIEGATAVSVNLTDGTRLDAQVVGADARADVAVLKVNGEDLPCLSLGRSDDLMAGEWVIAIGNPFGPYMRDPQPTVSVGVVSANRRRISPDIAGGERLYQDMIQTDAAINPGNSGGPLVNANGQVVGINTMIFSQSGGSVGLGFAIPINRVKRVADELISYGRRRDVWPGFRVERVDSYPDVFRQRNGITATEGCLVVEILENSPAYEAGLRVGDVVVGVNEDVVEVPSDLNFAIWGMFVDENVSLEVDRRGTQGTVQFKLKEFKR